MQKTLDTVSLIIKLLTVALGALTATDASVLHLTTGALGTVVSGLGTAAVVVKALQLKTAA